MSKKKKGKKKKKVKVKELSLVFVHFRIPSVIEIEKQRGMPVPAMLKRWSRRYGWLFDYLVLSEDIKPHPNGGSTECYIYDGNGKAIAFGEAVCSLQDQFCYNTGRTIAEGRAMDKLFPEGVTKRVKIGGKDGLDKTAKN